MVRGNAYQSYKQQSVMTMTPGEMLTTLYDEILKELARANIAFESKDNVEVNRSLQKVQLIFRSLKSSLDFKYEISENLNSLYDYFINLALNANIKKNPEGLDEIVTMINELKDSYAQADRKTRMTENAG